MSRSQRDRCEERFHAHHSGTYSASAETLGPDELLALAPNDSCGRKLSCRHSTFYRRTC